MSQPSLNHIMYVDDEPDMRMLVQLVLENSGTMRVTLCESGFEVLESAIDNQPQIIVLDVMMADMDGPAILKEIRANEKISHIPIVFLTAKSDARDIELLKQLGAIGVITKPFDLVTLPDQIRSLWEAAP